MYGAEMSFIPAHPGAHSCVFMSVIFFFPILTETHAHLSTKHTGFEERVYNISIRISDGDRQPLEGIVSLPGRYFAAGNFG